MKYGTLPIIGALGFMAVSATGCLDMSFPTPQRVVGESCPSKYAKTTQCADGEECVELSDGTICVKIKLDLGGGNGPNCLAGYVTVSDTESEMSKCVDEDSENPDESEYYSCAAGNFPGRKCRKIPEESANSTVVVHEGQMCTKAQLELDGKSLRIHIIDVGQGDAIWIQTPTGQNILVDSGDLGLYGKTAGGPIVADYLEFHDFTPGMSFDAVILSHPDSDHYGGMAYLFRSLYNVNAYIDPYDPTRSSEINASYATWVDVVKGRVDGANIIAPAEQFYKTGDKMDFFGSDVEATYITSSKNMASADNRNSTSIIFKISYAGRSMLFTGDSEKTREGAAVKIAQENPDLVGSNFLKVCHHGSESNDSSSTSFLNAVWPDTIERSARGAYISSGRYAFSGRYLPYEEVVSRLFNYMPQENVFSTNAGDGAKDEDEAVRDDNILIVIKPDGSYYSCYSGVN